MKEKNVEQSLNVEQSFLQNFKHNAAENIFLIW